MVNVTLHPLTTTIVSSPEARAEALLRLDHLKAVLDRNGIRSLDALGPMTLSGVVLAQPGITVPFRQSMHGGLPSVPKRPVGVLLGTVGDGVGAWH
ncbi:MAG TPA: hypothetical protein VFB74_22510 [Kribbellaceae bacterium]|nr:hypothetical protein [Kribbellaceae bacterium]